MNRSAVAIVVAVGPLNRGKSRLGPTLDADGRRRLVLAMLEDVLAAVAEVHDGPRYVVTPDLDSYVENLGGASREIAAVTWCKH